MVELHMHLSNSAMRQFESLTVGENHLQNEVSGFSELPEPMGGENHRFLSPQRLNPREQI